MSTQGIYVSPTEFVRFADRGRAQRRSLATEVATRQRSPDFQALGMYLPNPDPILKRQGKDISVYTDLRSDAHVGGCIRRRKAGVVKLEWRVERGKASARMAKVCERVISELDRERLIRETLNAPLLGRQPLEVMWSGASGAMVPISVEAKPAKWFHYDADAQLRFKSREAPFDGELLQHRKFLVPTQEASYENPYGFADLSMCFWPTVFKRGGLKFWVTFTEKFGTPWLVGKVPRGTGRKEQNELLEQLEAMVQDAVAVIPDDGSVDVVEAIGKTGSAELYERLLMFCRSEVAIALLGQNQTTEANSNRASAEAGLQVTSDLRDADSRLVEKTVNELFRWIVDLNEGPHAPAPTYELFEQTEVDKVQAERDEILVRAGARLTREYFMRTYDLEERDIEQGVAPPVKAGAPLAAPPLGEAAAAAAAAAKADADAAAAAALAAAAPAAAFAEQAPPPPDAIDTLVAQASSEWQAVMSPMVAPLQAAIDEALARGETAGELLARLPQLVESLDAAALQDAVARTTFAARLAAEAGAQVDGSMDEASKQPAAAEPEAAAFAEAGGAQKLEVHVHLTTPAPVVENTVVVPQGPAPKVEVEVHPPSVLAPEVHLHTEVKPADVTVVGGHPQRAVQRVERDGAGEVTQTVTEYQFGERGAS